MAKEPTREMRQRAFGQALAQAMAAAKFTQADLARALGNASQGGVSGWVTGKSAPDTPDDVFRIERVLGTKPGALSRHLGYVPPGAVKIAASYEDAIAGDSALTPTMKRTLLELYRQLTGREQLRRGR